MNVHHKASHIFVGGKSGMGKTTLAIRYLNASPHDRVFIFDHQGEFAERLQLGQNRVAHSEEEFWPLAEQFRIVPFDFTQNFAGYVEEAFDEFCELVFSAAQGGFEPAGKTCLFVCDELQRFVTPQDCPLAFKTMVETGRRCNLDTLSLSQRPNAINAAIREQFTEMFLFRLQDENSLKFAGAIGADVDRVMNLPEHEFLYFNVIRGTERSGKLGFLRAAPPPAAAV